MWPDEQLASIWPSARRESRWSSGVAATCPTTPVSESRSSAEEAELASCVPWSRTRRRPRAVARSAASGGSVSSRCWAVLEEAWMLGKPERGPNDYSGREEGATCICSSPRPTARSPFARRTKSLAQCEAMHKSRVAHCRRTPCSITVHRHPQLCGSGSCQKRTRPLSNGAGDGLASLQKGLVVAWPSHSPAPVESCWGGHSR